MGMQQRRAEMGQLDRTGIVFIELILTEYDAENDQESWITVSTHVWFEMFDLSKAKTDGNDPLWSVVLGEIVSL